MAQASRTEKKQAEYGSDVVVDMLKAFDIEYTAFNPGRASAASTTPSSTTAATTTRR